MQMDEGLTTRGALGNIVVPPLPDGLEQGSRDG